MIRRWLLRRFFRSAPGGPKMLHETLCVAQTRISDAARTSRVLSSNRAAMHVDRLQWLIDELEATGSYQPGGWA